MTGQAVLPGTATKATLRRWRSEELVAALERRFNPPSKPRQYATFTEVTDAAQRRRVDFLAVNLWQSRGRHVEGVEVKVARSDWLRELANPKADSWYAVCDRWWIASPPGVILDGELPSAWGQLEVRPHALNGPRMHVVAKPLESERSLKDRTLPHWLTMRLLARGEDRRTATPAEIAAAREEARLQGYEHGVAHGERTAAISVGAEKELARVLAALGVDRMDFDEDRCALLRRAVALCRSPTYLDRQEQRMAEAFRAAAQAIEDARAARGSP